MLNVLLSFAQFEPEVANSRLMVGRQQGFWKDHSIAQSPARQRKLI